MAPARLSPRPAGDDHFEFSAGDVPGGQSEFIRGGDDFDTARFFFGGGSDGDCPSSVTDPDTGGTSTFENVERCEFD